MVIYVVMNIYHVSVYEMNINLNYFTDKVKVNYSRNSIVQASYLKENLEEMGLNKEEVTIASVDAINMYPSIKLATIKKEVRFFARKLTTEVKKTINLCLDLIQFGMSSTRISFDRWYYEYLGGRERRTRIQICIPGGPSRFLPFRKIQANFPPENLPLHLSRWRPGSFQRKEEGKWD